MSVDPAVVIWEANTGDAWPLPFFDTRNATP